MRRNVFFWVAMIFCLLLVLGVMPNETREVAFAQSYVEEELNISSENEIEIIFGKEIRSIDEWYNFDGVPDYYYIDFADGSYAVLYKSTFEPLEFSDSNIFFKILQTKRFIMQDLQCVLLRQVGLLLIYYRKKL